MSTAQPTARDFGEWGDFFLQSGTSEGEPLPNFTFSDLDGNEHSIKSLLKKPLILVTSSLTCPVARSRVPELSALVEGLGDSVRRIIIYTREAHPVVDPAPHADGKEWVTDANRSERILHRQPRDLERRMALARKFADGWAEGFEVLVDGMENTFYNHMGTAPCMGILLGTDGVVLKKYGWLESEALAADAAVLVG